MQSYIFKGSKYPVAVGDHYDIRVDNYDGRGKETVTINVTGFLPYNNDLTQEPIIKGEVIDTKGHIDYILYEPLEFIHSQID